MVVYDVLREQIITGVLEPGVPLVETTLAKSLGVSRTPVREALRRLEQDALVERVHRGLQVRQRSMAEILEIYEVRIALEGRAARGAAERHAEADRIQLDRTLAIMDSAAAADPTQMAAANKRFHSLIWQASHNQALVDVLERLKVHLDRYPTTTFEMPGRMQSAHLEHVALLDAIIGRQADDAERLAVDHMTAARNTRIAMWREAETSETTA